MTPWVHLLSLFKIFSLLDFPLILSKLTKSMDSMQEEFMTRLNYSNKAKESALWKSLFEEHKNLIIKDLSTHIKLADESKKFF